MINSLLYCLNLGKGSLNIQDISFGLKNKFLLIHYNTYQFDLIKIKKNLKDLNVLVVKRINLDIKD